MTISLSAQKKDNNILDCFLIRSCKFVSVYLLMPTYWFKRKLKQRKAKLLSKEFHWLGNGDPTPQIYTFFPGSEKMFCNSSSNVRFSPPVKILFDACIDWVRETIKQHLGDILRRIIFLVALVSDKRDFVEDYGRCFLRKNVFKGLCLVLVSRRLFFGIYHLKKHYE